MIFTIFQFDVKNTLDDQLLDNLRVHVEPQDDDEGLWEVRIIFIHL